MSGPRLEAHWMAAWSFKAEACGVQIQDLGPEQFVCKFRWHGRASLGLIDITVQKVGRRFTL